MKELLQKVCLKNETISFNKITIIMSYLLTLFGFILLHFQNVKKGIDINKVVVICGHLEQDM